MILRILLRTRRRSWAALLGSAAVLCAAGGAAAQEPPPRPPVPPPDTTAATDSLPRPDSAAVAADTLEPVMVVPRFPRGEAPGWTAGRWEWDRDALQASGAVTLTDLLERIPGIQPVRYGLFGHPEAVNAWGMTGGRLEVVLDGFALDPLDAGTQDLSRIELAALARVRVERGAGRVRVELETIAPEDPQPFSMIEAGTGQPDDAKMIRGVFMTPRFLGGPLSLGVDRVDSDGFGRAEPANTFAGWAKWGIVSGSSALQFELRRSSVERRLPTGEVVDGSRQDWVLRARSTPLDRVTTEAFFGVSSIDEGLYPGAVVETDTAAAPRTEMTSAQGGVRAAYRGDHAWSRALVRLRSRTGLPLVETELAGGLDGLGPLRLSGTVSWSDWRDGRRAAAYGARAELGPFLGLRPFAEVAGGRRGVPFLQDSTGAAILTDRTSLRVGGEFARGGFRLAGAFIDMSADSLPAYELPFDRGAGLHAGGDLQGWEVTGRIPLFWEPLALEGWYTRWTGASPWIYLPRETWRAGLVYTHSPLPSGNLDIMARVEGRHRGAVSVPGADGGLSELAPYTAFDAYLQIRILSVRLFVRWENLTRRLDIRDLPDRTFPAQRVFYGVKWQFWN